MDHKAKIIDALEKLRQKEIANHEPFKVRAYNTVIKNLKAFDSPITDISDIKDIKGIGAKIYIKIKEILETGELKQLEVYDEKITIINNLTNIHGIGPVKAKDLVEKHNIKSIDELKDRQELLNDKQIIGLRYYQDFNLRIPRQEMVKHELFIMEHIQKVIPEIAVQVVGSYRRGANDSGDIDVIITHIDNPENYDNIIKNIISELKKVKYLYDDFAVGTHKYLGVCRLKYHKIYRRIDILYATKNVWPFSILYFTGSAEFNIILRNLALSKGYSLNEYGFTPKPKQEFETEEDIFKFLGLRYIEPIERTPKINLDDFKFTI
jgi:DNA polymerase beta